MKKCNTLATLWANNLSKPMPHGRIYGKSKSSILKDAGKITLCDILLPSGVINDDD